MKHLWILGLCVLLCSGAVAQSVVLDDFESGFNLADWTTGGYPTLTHVTTDGANGTSSCLNITDGGWSMNVSRDFPSVVPADGDYKITFWYRNGHADAYQDNLQVKINGIGTVSLPRAQVDDWTFAETGFAYGLTAGSTVTLEIAGQRNETLTQQCRFDEFTLVKELPPVSGTVHPLSGDILSNVATLTVTVITDCPSGVAGAGTLFIGLSEPGGVAVVEGATTADDHTGLDRLIAGAQTLMIDPNYYSCFVAADAGELYVGDEGVPAIHVFSPAATVDGNTAPARSIQGSAVPLVEPGGIAVDETRDILYVADLQLHRVHVWDDASTVNGNTAPDRTIEPGRWVNDIFIDEANDRAYLCGDSSICVLEGVSSRNGVVAPDREVTGAATGLQGGAMAVDLARDRLYISVRDDERILVFSNVTTMDGNVAPLHIIEGDRTGLDAPMDLCLDPVRGHLYQINDSGRDQTVRVWHNAPAINGNVAPDRAISNAAGLLHGVVSIFFVND